MEKEIYPRSLSEFEAQFATPEDCRQGCLPYYLDEFTFRFNRRTSASRGKLFFRLVQHLLAVDPAPRPTLVGLCKGDEENEFDTDDAKMGDHNI